MEPSLKLKHGDFTKLASMYSHYRPGYSSTVLKAILGIVGKPVTEIDFADVGAGTGIWTRMVAEKNCRSVVAVEPNAEMRKMGMGHVLNRQIQWQEGSGEMTHLDNESIDLLSMASSFHWVNFEAGTKEFYRVLREGGHFVALWNPRYIDDNPLLVDIEKKIYALAPHIKRVSSGKSEFVDNLSGQLLHSPYFEDLTYLEGRHTNHLTPEQYIGVWNSVNDIRSQMGEAVFEQFMHFVRMQVESLTVIPCTYLTRAWIVRKK
jgi:ubiquinone/menaquinone biosynthesis C-methylase UbiE